MSEYETASTSTEVVVLTPDASAQASPGAEDPSQDPRSLRSLLSLLPSGATPGSLSLDELGRYLAKKYDTHDERERNQRHTERDELYRDGGERVMHRLMDEVLQDPTVRELRKKWIKASKYNNALKRIVNELSTVYSKPAKRSVKGGNEVYQQALERMFMDEQMLQLGRLLNLHRQLLIGVRVRQKPDGTREPVLDIHTPATVRAIIHPNDSTLVIGWMIRTDYRTSDRPGIYDLSDAPAWTVWSDFEVFQLRADFSVITYTYKTHKIGQVPFVAVSLSPPRPGFWVGEEGEDLVSAHLSIWFTNILSAKEAKSATKQTILKGDGTNMARGQAADSEVPIELADGQSAETVDMSMDLKIFEDRADHVLKHAAQNYGMSPAIVTHQGVQSAEARELMRIPLRELREQQQVPLRRFEMALVVVMAAVFTVDLPELKFDPAGFSIEFGQPETPLSRSDDLNLFIGQRQAGITNTVEYMMRLFNIDQPTAENRLRNNYELEQARLVLAKPLAALSGGMANVSPAAPADVPAEEKDGAPKANAGSQE